VSEERCHNRHCVVCTDIKEVETANSKDSVKQEDTSSSHPTYDLDSAPSDIHSIVPAPTRRMHTDASSKILRDRHTESHEKVEKSFLKTKENLRKNNLYFETFMHTICVPFVIIVIRAFIKKK
jgi:hypothetical protein